MLIADLKLYNSTLDNSSHSRTIEVEIVFWSHIPINNSLLDNNSNLFGLQ